VRSIAVLPFRSLGPDRLDEYLRLGLADALITRLGYVQRLEVRPTGSVRSFLDGPVDPVAAGRALGVDAVLEGQIQRNGARTRVTVQLVGVRRAATVWSEKFDVRSGDLFEIEDTISNAVTRAVVSGLSEGEKLLLTRRRATTPEAYQAYLKGRYYWNRRTQDSFRKGVEAFRHAIEADPEYAPAYAGLADSYNFLGFVPEAKKAAGRALELDATLAEAHAALGNAALFYDFQRTEAEREFRRAIDLSPSYATAHQWLAYDLAAAGRFDQAIAEIRRARDLDPLSLSIATDVGDILYYARRYDEALRECRKAIEMDPHFLQAHLTLGRILEEKGEMEAAIRELSYDELGSDLARAYAIAGRSTQARAILEKLPRFHPTGLWHWERARIFASLGEKDRAFEWLERAYKARYGALVLLGVDPQFDSLHGDPRFDALMRRIGLES
jgi:TolB-like protein/Tfp pilus assembly protein PilF